LIIGIWYYCYVYMKVTVHFRDPTGLKDLFYGNVPLIKVIISCNGETTIGLTYVSQDNSLWYMYVVLLMTMIKSESVYVTM